MRPRSPGAAAACPSFVSCPPGTGYSPGGSNVGSVRTRRPPYSKRAVGPPKTRTGICSVVVLVLAIPDTSRMSGCLSVKDGSDFSRTSASRTMRAMSEISIAEAVPPPAPGAADYLAIDFVNSVLTRPGGHLIDLLATPASTNLWLTERGLAPADAGIREMCASQLRSLREQLKSLFDAHVAGLPALPTALSAVNDALSGAPTAALLQWDAKNGPYRATPCPTNEIL